MLELQMKLLSAQKPFDDNLIVIQLWLDESWWEENEEGMDEWKAGCWCPSSCVISLNGLAAECSLHRLSAVKHL